MSSTLTEWGGHMGSQSADGETQQQVLIRETSKAADKMQD